MLLLQLALCMLSALLGAADNTATSLGWNTRHGSRAAHRQHTHTKLHPSICHDPTDCTAELQAALDAGGTIALTCTQDQPSWVTRPLNVTRNNTWLGLGAGCELLAKRGEFKGEFDALLTIRGPVQHKPGDPGQYTVRNISIVGVGGQAKLRMHRSDYNNSNVYSHSEHRHGIAIIGGITGPPAPGESVQRYAGGVFDVTVRDLNITLTGGDGVYISGLTGGHISRVHNTACYRQGSSVVDARNVIYEDCSFTGTEGTAPSAGVDIEPNAWTQSFVNLTFRRCNSTNNHGAGFMMCIYHLREASAPLGVRFEDCHVRNVGLGATATSSAIPGGGFVLSASSSNESKTTAQGSIVWDGGSITDTTEEAIHISRPEPGGVISFSNLELANNAVNMSCASSNCFPNFTHRTNITMKVPVGTGSSSRTGRGTPNPLFILFNVFDSAGLVTKPSDGLLLSNVLVKDSLHRPFAYVASHSRNVLGTNITVSNTNANGCGKGLLVPFESKAHFAKYGGNVNLTIAHCIIADRERFMLKSDDAELSPLTPTSVPSSPSPGVRIMFEPPFLVDANRSGPSMMDTTVPENFHRLGPQSLSATHIFGPGHSPGPESLDFSRDNGAHWEGGPSGTGIAMPFPIMAPSGDQCQAMIINHGDDSASSNRTVRFACDPPDFSNFSDGSGWTQHGYSEFSLSPNGSLQGSNARVRSTWSGIPAPGLNVSSARPAELFGGCSAIVELPGGGWLASICVTWNGVQSHASPDGPIKPVSIVAFRSHDGFNWLYQSTIANISDFPGSVFGPNEHDLSILADGKSIICAIRMDGDAGCSTDTYRYYSQSYSTDLGVSWSLPRPIPGAGCARPRLMLMEPHGPLLLSGGRLCVENTTGIFLWVNADGLAGLNGGDDKKIWQRHSIADIHNQFWQGADYYRFDASINDTNAFASLSYTSLIQTSPTSAAVIYNKFFSPYAWPPWPSANFLLRFSFVAGNRVPVLKNGNDDDDNETMASQPGVNGFPPNLYCRSGTLGGGVLATANMTVWDAAQQCNNRSLFGGSCAGWTTHHVYPTSCDPNSTAVFQILFKDSTSLGKPIATAGWTYFRAIRLPPPLPPPPPPPPSPPPPGAVRLSLQAGMPVDPYYFGWDLEGWTDAMYGTSFPFNDTGGVSLTEALSPGVLRYPGGTGSNIWNMTSGRFTMPPKGYSTYGPIAKYDGALPDGLLGAAAYLRGLGGVAKRAVWNLNVYSYTVNETCDEIRMISQLPGQQEPGVLLELGNEFYIGGQGRPKFPNAQVYAKYVTPIVACARQLMPKALIGAVGCHGRWNQGLRPYVHLFDGITIHNYSPRTRDSWVYPDEGDRFSFYAGYSRASAMADAQQLVIDLGGAKKPIWLTEFQAGLDPPTDCLMPEHIFGALHGSFHAARVIAAINQPGDYSVLTWQTFMSPVDYPKYPNDWCGQAAGLIKSPGFPNRPDLAQVTGPAQLVAHMFSRALEMDTMHPANISGGPAMQFPILGQEQPCLQAAGFTGNNSVMIALLNICNTTIPVTLEIAVDNAHVTATEYSFLDKGGKAGLPKHPKQFPWPGPLAAKTTNVRTGWRQTAGHTKGGGALYSAQPFTFAIVEGAQPRHKTDDTAALQIAAAPPTGCGHNHVHRSHCVR